MAKQIFHSYPSDRRGAALYSVGRGVQKSLETLATKFQSQDNSLQDYDKAKDSVVLKTLDVPDIKGSRGTYNTEKKRVEGGKTWKRKFNNPKGTYSAKSGELKFTSEWDQGNHFYVKGGNYPGKHFEHEVEVELSANRSESPEAVSYELKETRRYDGVYQTSVVVDKSTGSMTVDSTLPQSLPTDFVLQSPGESWEFSSTGPSDLDQIESWERANSIRSEIDSEMERLVGLDNTAADLNPEKGKVVLAELDRGFTESSVHFDPESGEVKTYSSADSSTQTASFERGGDGSLSYVSNQNKIEEVLVNPDGSLKLTEFEELNSPSETMKAKKRQAEADQVAAEKQAVAVKEKKDKRKGLLRRCLGVAATGLAGAGAAASGLIPTSLLAATTAAVASVPIIAGGVALGAMSFGTLIGFASLVPAAMFGDSDDAVSSAKLGAAAGAVLMPVASIPLLSETVVPTAMELASSNPLIATGAAGIAAATVCGVAGFCISKMLSR